MADQLARPQEGQTRKARLGQTPELNKRRPGSRRGRGLAKRSARVREVNESLFCRQKRGDERCCGLGRFAARRTTAVGSVIVTETRGNAPKKDGRRCLSLGCALLLH